MLPTISVPSIEAFAPALVRASLTHCENSGEDHYVGDMQDVFARCFEAMDVDRLREFFSAGPVTRILASSPRSRQIRQLRALRRKTGRTAHRAAYLLADELGFHPPMADELRLVAAALALALTAAGPETFRGLIDDIRNRLFCLQPEDFDGPVGTFLADGLTS